MREEGVRGAIVVERTCMLVVGRGGSFVTEVEVDQNGNIFG